MTAVTNSDNRKTGRPAATERLESILREMGRVMIAFSGGVDSSFLLNKASTVLGREAVRAVIVDSPLLGEGEVEEAVSLASGWDLRYEVIGLDPLGDDRVSANPRDRCYLCKKLIFAALCERAREAGIPWILDGTNADDEGTYRPGMKALEELGVRSPLREAGFTKEAIREGSRIMGLATWDRPSAPCLATRFPYGQRISAEDIRRVDRAERVLRSLGFEVVRVRCHGDLVRIEVPPDRIPELMSAAVGERISSAFKDLGFSYITVDLEGFRSGSMDEVLEQGGPGGGP